MIDASVAFEPWKWFGPGGARKFSLFYCLGQPLRRHHKPAEIRKHPAHLQGRNIVGLHSFAEFIPQLGVQIPARAHERRGIGSGNVVFGKHLAIDGPDPLSVRGHPPFANCPNAIHCREDAPAPLSARRDPHLVPGLGSIQVETQRDVVTMRCCVHLYAQSVRSGIGIGLGIVILPPKGEANTPGTDHVERITQPLPGLPRSGHVSGVEYLRAASGKTCGRLECFKKPIYLLEECCPRILVGLSEVCVNILQSGIICPVLLGPVGRYRQVPNERWRTKGWRRMFVTFSVRCVVLGRVWNVEIDAHSSTPY